MDKVTEWFDKPKFMHCNCPQWITCWADELLHRFHIVWPWLCDRHDRNILGDES